MAIAHRWDIQAHIVGVLVSILVIIDVHHCFHIVSLSLVSHEDTNIYIEVFTMQKEAL